MQNQYKIYPEIHFGISKLSPGVKSMEELLDFAEQFRKEKDFPEVHYQLTDMRNCLFDFKSHRIEEMKSLIDSFKNIDNQKLGVYLVDQPIETAYVELFFRSMEYKREFCSTIEKAYILLSLPISFENFKLLINI
ncbi:MAG: hypothetical protein ABFS38_13215 [Bacteroidota bacterium]